MDSQTNNNLSIINEILINKQNKKQIKYMNNFCEKKKSEITINQKLNNKINIIKQILIKKIRMIL